MENRINLIERRNSDRRRIEQQAALSRREGERRRLAAEEGMRELRASTRRHLAIVAAQMAQTDAAVTDWARRFHERRRGVAR